MNDVTITLGYYDAQSIAIALQAAEDSEQAAGHNMTANMLYGIRRRLEADIARANPDQEPPK
jgi:hypothetical protein